MSKKNKKVKPSGLFHINVPIGAMPSHRVREYIDTLRAGYKNAFKKHGTVIITPFRGDGRVEIIRVI